jgi:lipopolysaccharide transport system ATP-binding protein
VASLLEVGTGFHGEMTGRENIFLNGAILGMTKKEINAKLDEIIEFSGCERYIDTPVKRYSSGMTVRLAFAVAAFLEPDILIIDEVLAVGDAEFQKKAIGKMQEISKGGGRTVLFVSHNMAAVKSLCTRGIVLENGEIVFDGDTDEAVNYYLKGGSESSNKKIFNGNFDTKIFKLHEIAINNTAKNEDQPIVEDETIELTTKLTLLSENPERYYVTYHLYNEMGEALFSFGSSQSNIVMLNDLNILTCFIPKSFLQPGQYFLSLFIVEDKRKAIFVEKDILSFTIINAQREIGVYMGKEPGSIRPAFKWEIA